MEEEEVYNEDFENLSDHHEKKPLEEDFDDKNLEGEDDLGNLEDIEKELLELEEKSKPEQKKISKPQENNKNEGVKKSKEHEKPPKPKANPPPKKKVEERPNLSRQNSVGSQLSGNPVRKGTKEKVSIVRSHSSRSRQDDLMKEDNAYMKKVEAFIQEKNYDKMTDHQIIQENNLLRLHLKNFNNELNTIIERQALKPLNKVKEAVFVNKPASARLRTVVEEMKNNEKKLSILREEMNKSENRLQAISDGVYLVSLQERIENAKKSIEEQKKTNKVILLDQKKHGKNLDNIENVAGMPEKLMKGNEIASLLPGLSRKNQHLKDKNDTVMIQIEELERKNEAIQDKFEKALKLADAYKLFKNDKKREQYEISQAKVEALEKNIGIINKKNEKSLEMHKKTMEDLMKSLKERDDLISTKEKEVLIQRQKIEELMLTEKINKNELLKIMPPTPKTNNSGYPSFGSRKKLETPIQALDSEREKEKQEQTSVLKEDEENMEFKTYDNEKKVEASQNNKEKTSGGRLSPVNEHGKEKSEDFTQIVKEQNSPNKNLNDNNKEKSLERPISQKSLLKETEKNTNTIDKKPEEDKSGNTINQEKNEQSGKTFNFGQKAENKEPLNKSPEKKNDESQGKTLNLSKKEPEEAKTFNFSKKKPDEKLVLNQNEKKVEPNPTKIDKKKDLFSDDNEVGFIPEIKTIENQEKVIDNHKISNETTNNQAKNEPMKLSSKPKKIIADPFEDKPKNENFDNEFFDDKPKPMKMAMNNQKKKETKEDLLAKAEKGENDFFGDLE